MVVLWYLFWNLFIVYVMTFILGIQYGLLCAILLLISVHALEVQAHYLTLNLNYTFLPRNSCGLFLKLESLTMGPDSQTLI